MAKLGVSFADGSAAMPVVANDGIGLAQTKVGEATCCSSSLWGSRLGDYWADNVDRNDMMFEPFTRPLLQAARIGPGDHVIDIGCGSGSTTREAARIAWPAPVVGIDISASILKVAESLAESNMVPNARFVWADAQKYRFQPRMADVVISRFGTMFFDDPLAAFSNIASAMRPGGRLAFLCWRKLSGQQVVALPLYLLATLAPSMMAGGAAGGPYSLANPLRTKRMLAAAGFSAPTLTPIEAPLLLGKDAGDVMSFYLGQPAVQACLSGLSPAGLSTLPEALSSLRMSLEAHETPRGVVMNAPAWLATAVRSERSVSGPLQSVVGRASEYSAPQSLRADRAPGESVPRCGATPLPPGRRW